MAEKVTTMVLEVDLQCPCCYKMVKELLCKFPQIRDQVYDEKKNTVTITVICCSPEKIRDKLCCKGGKVIKRIEIKPPHKTQPPPDLVPPPAPIKVEIIPPQAPIKVEIIPPQAPIKVEIIQPPGYECPCYHDYWRPPPCYVFLSDENTSGCTIM